MAWWSEARLGRHRAKHLQPIHRRASEHVARPVAAGAALMASAGGLLARTSARQLEKQRLRARAGRTSSLLLQA